MGQAAQSSAPAARASPEGCTVVPGGPGEPSSQETDAWQKDDAKR